MKFLIYIEEGMIQPYLFHVKNLTNFIWQNVYNNHWLVKFRFIWERIHMK